MATKPPTSIPIAYESIFLTVWLPRELSHDFAAFVWSRRPLCHCGPGHIALHRGINFLFGGLLQGERKPPEMVAILCYFWGKNGGISLICFWESLNENEKKSGVEENFNQLYSLYGEKHMAECHLGRSKNHLEQNKSTGEWLKQARSAGWIPLPCEIQCETRGCLIPGNGTSIWQNLVCVIMGWATECLIVLTSFNMFKQH